MTLKVAVIGVGAMGRNHARVYADMSEVALVGVADVNETAAAEVARRYGGRAYADYRELLDEQRPDAVTLAVPTVDHLEMALEVIRRGIHLLIEKPIAFTVAEGQEIIRAARQAGVKLMIGHVERFNPAVLALKARLADGELGRVFQIDARRQGPFPDRVKDVGVVIDLAVHDLDVMRYITGAEVARVFAETERRIHSTREDLLSGLVRLADGTVGTLTINWLTPTKIRELYVTGELGMFRVDYLTQDLYFFENADAPVGDWPFRVLRGVSEGRMIRHVIPKREPLRIEQESFLAAVTGEIPIAVTGADGLKALELAQAIVNSGVEHRVVELGDD
ncbi:MAG: Gfo/Idh/MocA family oxidoreductase [Chloroflexi bacterium]|nr:Gfo/Idh/MocA family oxidoreductase [Chloroflexota bacterium]MCI0645244.1 Gfo/Idh/MocA family oxidoreductase [Chloroflexota bacterium]MCI0725316.1 Gfo/Idh/MocA family oxidoreductase [Chloroflexota bacterium]